MKKTVIKKIPKFKNEDEEREFWAVNDATDYFDLSKARYALFPNLKLSTQVVKLKLPLWIVDKFKALANKHDVSYQSLIKVYLGNKIVESSSKRFSKTADAVVVHKDRSC